MEEDPWSWSCERRSVSACGLMEEGPASSAATAVSRRRLDRTVFGVSDLVPPSIALRGESSFRVVLSLMSKEEKGSGGMTSNGSVASLPPLSEERTEVLQVHASGMLRSRLS